MKKVLSLIGLVSLSWLSSLATTVIPMSVEELTERSSHVVEAHASKSWSSWNVQHTMISTYTEFSVENWLKGSGETVITVMQPGGSAEGFTQHVAGVHGWSAGESAVLFLQPSAAHDGTFTVSGLMQGNFRVRHLASGAAIADNGVAGSTKQMSSEEVHSFNSADRSVTPYAGNRMDLSELKRRVRSAIHTR